MRGMQTGQAAGLDARYAGRMARRWNGYVAAWHGLGCEGLGPDGYLGFGGRLDAAGLDTG